jgi:WD40 repeat protein
MANIASEPKKTRREIDTPHTYQLRCVSLSHNNQLIAVGSRDKTLSVFDVNTLQLIHHLKGHTNGVEYVCFSYDDKLIASASHDKRVIVWSVSTGEITHRLKGHTHWVMCVCFSNDDTLIASGSADAHGPADETIIVWSVSTGEVIHRLTGHTNSVGYVCFSNDDYYLWSKDGYSRTRVFEVISGKCVSKKEPLWAVTNYRWRGKSADGRFEYSLDTDCYRSSGHKIIIEVVEGDKESTKSVESKTAAKVCVDWSIFPKNCLEVFFRLLRQHNNCIHSFANVSTEVSTRA